MSSPNAEEAQAYGHAPGSTDAPHHASAAPALGPEPPRVLRRVSYLSPATPDGTRLYLPEGGGSSGRICVAVVATSEQPYLVGNQRIRVRDEDRNSIPALVGSSGQVSNFVSRAR